MALDYRAFARALVEDDDHLRAWDRIILSPEIRTLPGFDAARLPAHEFLPPLRFTAFHPDCCYVFVEDEAISGGVVHQYHSMIALAAYKEGLDAARAAAWFEAATYARGGYFAQWAAQRALVLAEYRDCGLDVSGLFRRAARGRSFMHTINHPAIEALFEIARALLVARGQPVFDGVPPPADNLMAAQWPIYPEIGDAIGVPGAYLFKPFQHHKPIELLEFVDRSLAHFAGWPPAALGVLRPIRPHLQTIRRHMRGEE